MNVAIVKYNAGNIYSVVHALRRIGIVPIVTDDLNQLQSADRIIFPGQGEALKTMSYLKSHRLDLLIRDLKQPVLGICIGLQLMCRHSDEGNVDCLGIFDVDVKRFLPTVIEEKVPHMGWNTLEQLQSPLFKGISDDSYVYFVHSYYAPLCSHTISVTNYIVPFSAALHKNNYYATQFHPEKSGDIGEQILRNFIELSV